MKDQIANIHWIIEKAKKFQEKKKIYLCFIDYTKPFDCVSQQTVENSSRDGNTRPPYLPPEKLVCRSRSYRVRNETAYWLKIGKGVHQAVYCHPVYLT